MSVCNPLIYKSIYDALEKRSLTPELLNALTKDQPQVCIDCITLTCPSIESIDPCKATCFT